MDRTRDIKLYATHPHDCSYLEGREASSVFVDPELSIDREIYSQLSEYGFRRSGEHLYRPRCSHCQACIAARIPVADFTPTRQQKRCWRRNQDIEITVAGTIFTEEHYQLYADYIGSRHADGDMYPPTRHQYESFLAPAWDSTRYLEMRLDGKLIGVAVSDEMNNGLSAVYTFFDASEIRRSLGMFAVLYQIELARREQLPAVYLGYWIKECPKMNYKSQYRPLELLISNRWIRLN